MLMGDHFNQRHFLDRAEEMQANHLPRSAGLRRNVADGQRRGIGGKDRLRAAVCFDLSHHPLFKS